MILRMGRIAVGAAIIIMILLGLAGCILHYIPLPWERPAEWTAVNTRQWGEEDMLHAEGNRIVNGRGEEILLSGVNLGGWLLQEYWMCPVKGEKKIEQWTELETLNVLEERFGSQRAGALMKRYQDNWITEADIRRIAGLGCNVIRVPFWYRNFMTDPQGTWISENPEENPGFLRLDWAIEMGEKYGLYVILDMHGCPGGQTTDHTAGSARKSELFENAECQDAMERLWRAIARRYRGNPVVAAYDIMNEPLAETEDIASDPRNLLYDRMLRAIREEDPEHMLAIEGIWSLYVLPDPEEAGWENVIYEVHLYGHEKVEALCSQHQKYSEEHQVPVYVGEYSDMRFLTYCREMGLHSTSWTYKGSKRMEETWFMYYADRMLSANVCRDPYWLIQLKWGRCLSTAYFLPDEALLSYWTH